MRYLGPALFTLLLVVTVVVCAYAWLAPAGPEPGILP